MNDVSMDSGLLARVRQSMERKPSYAKYSRPGIELIFVKDKLHGLVHQVKSCVRDEQELQFVFGTLLDDAPPEEPATERQHSEWVLTMYHRLAGALGDVYVQEMPDEQEVLRVLNRAVHLLEVQPK